MEMAFAMPFCRLLRLVPVFVEVLGLVVVEWLRLA